MIGKLGIMDHLKVLLISLIVSTFWFDVVYPYTKQTIEANPQIFFIIFTLIYAILAWYAASGFVNLPRNLLTQPRFFLIILLLSFTYDLAWFPYLVEPTGVPQLSAGLHISSDVFIYSLLPSFIPEYFKYNIVYPLTFSLSITLVSILAGSQKVFSNVVRSGF